MRHILALLAFLLCVRADAAEVVWAHDFRHNGKAMRVENDVRITAHARGAGDYSGNGRITFDGHFSPGNSPAIVTIAPQVRFTASNVLTMEIGGRTPGPGTPADNGYDKLIFTNAVAPQVTWGGTLDIVFINGFAPVAGDAFDLFDFNAALDAAAFGSVNAPLLGGGLAWDFSELYSTGTVRIAAAPVIAEVVGLAVSRTKIEVDCSVNPSGGNTTAWLEYGTSAALGAQTAPIPIGNGTAATTAHFELTGLVKNTLYFVRVRTGNAAGIAFSAPTLQLITFRGRYQEWAFTELGNVNAPPTADHDADGINNLTEYALALYPATVGVLPPFPQIRTYAEGQRLALMFHRMNDRDDLIIEAEVSPDLATWTTIATSTNSAPFTGAGFVSESAGLIEVRDTQNTTAAARRFLRIKLTLAP